MRSRARLIVAFGALALVAGACASDDAATPSSGATSSAVTSLVTESDSSTATTGPADSTGAEPAETEPVATDGPPGVQPDGFTTATVRITKADGEVCEVCMWLADVGDERSRGLMGVTDLGAAAGMAFVFPKPTGGAFYMFGTPTPLSIAWFTADGAFVSTTDMAPCLTAAADCERYRPGGEYQLAIEVFEGGLAGFGLGPGSTVEVLAATESVECVLAG